MADQIGFETYWSLYPRKIAKAAARKKYDQAIRKGHTHGAIIEGVTRFRDHVKTHGTPVQYIPHAATWLHNERWLDDLDAETAGNHTRAGQTSVSMVAATQTVQKAQAAMGREETNLDFSF